ncbi:MAG: hypothetical protein GX971_05890 [Firmicutes bacterium]|nr:hypothetical protein [Bacillota bacterium]
MKRNLLLVVLLCLILLTQGCIGGGGRVSTGKPPRIDALTPPTGQKVKVEENGEIEFTVSASHPDGNTLSYSWSQTGGGTFLASGNSRTAKWKAPELPGRARVKVEITDGKGGVVSHTWEIEVGDVTPVENIIRVTENIKEFTVWTADNVYVIDTDDIWLESELMIQPGTIIKFGQGKGLNIASDARLEALGQGDQPIVFTSLRDDDHGGDTNQDQSATHPERGDWASIFVHENAEAILDNCLILYGGAQDDEYMERGAVCVDYDSDKVEITNSEFSYNLVGLEMFLPEGYVVDSVFTNNVWPLNVGVDVSTTDTLEFENNDFNAIFLGYWNYSVSSESRVFWMNTQVPYVLTGSTEFMGGTIELGHGTIVKAMPGVIIKLWGESKFNNFENAIFTSYHDDEHGGDSDGEDIEPRVGDWLGIFHLDESITGPNVLYAGGI